MKIESKAFTSIIKLFSLSNSFGFLDCLDGLRVRCDTFQCFALPQVIHYLDTLRPQQLLAQMLCTAFMASADALRRTKAGDMRRLVSELEDLYAAMSVVLEPLSRLDRAGE